MKTHQRSKELYERAVKVIPGGVNSPVRAFRAVGGDPIFIHRGEGAYLYDVDGNRYLDCVGSWGPLILGHAHPDILSAISAQLPNGTTFGAPTELEVLFAEELCEAVPSLEKVRLVSSGTEATMSAIRAARGYTGRDIIVKFEGCYHGHADFLLAKAGSGVATLGLPECAGVPAAVTANTLTLPYNDIEALHTTFREYGSSIAGVIVEPVAGNMGCVPPISGFLEALREVTQRYGALLLFDEVMTGFRLAYGGAQERFGILPDLTMLGKIAGGGLPLGAFGGRADIMDVIAPVGPVYQAGTLSGNPVAVAAGLATVQTLKKQRHVLYERLDGIGGKLADAFRYAAEEAGVPVVVNQIGSMITVFFTDLPAVNNYAQAKTSNTQRFARWFRTLLEEGIYWPPSQFESAFLSDAMSDEDVYQLIETARAGFYKAREAA
ncbi:glutamate-1-semialdehyde 2,1-aminomutase [Chthonomonas calidirosea]|uniref:glutamate-1-semialdehyde 2,1-aminomutase n=1 Tax=Chthonomonas calidirosea TaxID=454171 RepID=UPI0006ECAC0D|nr:glutamate-1-semialdehyde 2,1-aminomutase [Chthonomonas calidirosea]CEK13138.1 glutamate-1-semialdehyde 2,1-aminomutase [Chthonomonas calidirosea]